MFFKRYQKLRPEKLTVAILATATLAAGCGRDSSPELEAEKPTEDFASYVERGDLPELRERGVLRILMPPRRPELLRQTDFPIDLERHAAEELAAKLGLEPEIIVLPREELLDALNNGRGDLVAARMKVTPERRKRFLFSIPIDHVRLVLVRPATAPEIDSVEELERLTLTVARDEIVADAAVELQDESVRVELAPSHLDEEQLAYQVGEGRIEATIADEDLVEAVSLYQENLGEPLPVTRERPVAWALRADSQELKDAVDRHLHESALTAELEGPITGDLDAIRERKVLRVLTRNNPATYFLHRGEQLGFDYELARRFARSLGVRLQIVVPREPGQLIPWLLEGRGDLVAASLLKTPQRQRRVAFSRPYNQASEVVVMRTGEVEGVESLGDLKPLSIAVQETSSHYETLRRLDRNGGFNVVFAPEELEHDGLVAGLVDGEVDAIVVDSNMLDIELTHRVDVEAAFALGDPVEIAWAVRPEDRELLAAADRFLARQRQGLFLAELKAKYFRDRGQMARTAVARPEIAGLLSPFDGLFRKYGSRFEIDWRLLTAQSHQESRWDPTARSWAGAIGLMQIMPRTARHMGIKGDLRDPEVSVYAGSKYYRWLLERYETEPDLPLSERLRFALASYNAGRGHVLDGRRLAREKGYDPDVWFGNVEEVIPLLSQRKYARRARYGYCRCQETVDYVRKISDRYVAYVRTIE